MPITMEDCILEKIQLEDEDTSLEHLLSNVEATFFALTKFQHDGMERVDVNMDALE